MFIETRKLPGRQLYLSDGEGSEGEEEEDEEHTEQYQGCTIRICKIIIPMTEFPLLFDGFLFHDTPHLARRNIATTKPIINSKNKRSAIVMRYSSYDDSHSSQITRASRSNPNRKSAIVIKTPYSTRTHIIQATRR